MTMNYVWTRLETSKRKFNKETSEREERKYLNFLVRLGRLEKTSDGWYKPKEHK